MPEAVGIVGGSGFIGSRLAEVLAQHGIPVTVLDRVHPPDDIAERCEFVRVDVTDRASVEGALDGCDVAILAAARLAKLCDEDGVAGWETNALGVRHVVEELCGRPSPAHVVFLSTGAVYRSPARSYPINETAPLCAADVYTASKLHGEQTLRAAAQQGLLSAVVLRLFTVYGPGPADGARGHFVANWVERALTGKPLVVHGDGAQTVDLTHVDDVVDACRRAASRRAGFRVFNVGSGVETSVREVAEWMCEVIPSLEVVSAPAPRAVASRQVADIRRARAELGYRPLHRPRIGVTDLLRATARASSGAEADR